MTPWPIITLEKTSAPIVPPADPSVSLPCKYPAGCVSVITYVPGRRFPKL